MSVTCSVLRPRRLHPTRVLLWLVCSIALSACGSKTQQQAAAPGTPAAQGAQTGTTEPASTAPAEPALAVTQASWSPDALEKLVAPIALYPDALVGQILAASVNSQEVLDGGNWLLQNQSLRGDALDAAAQKAGLGPAMRALVQFPQVIDMMCQEIDWTRQLGSAFTSDQKGVLDAVQHLRGQAQQVGNLKSTPQQKVTTKTENNQTIIEVQPADPQVVYVPQYNPQVVYTTPPPPPAPAAPASTAGTVSTGAAVAGGLVAFGVGMLIGSAIHSDDYCYPHWGAGAVYVGPRPFYPPAYVYHPVYGPAFHPASGYAPPPGYRYGYRNNNINGNVNINVNNNYFNQFNHNQNLRTNTQNNLSGATRNPNWKGQSTYAGARANPAQSARFNEAIGRPANAGAPGSSRSAAGYENRVGGAGSTRNPALANGRAAPSGLSQKSGLSQNRAGSSELGSGRAAGVDRGYGGSNRGGGDSGSGTGRNASFSRPESAPPRAADSGAGSSFGQRDHAFSGAADPGGGGFARAASARGNASVGSLGRAGGGRRR
jgi:Protein of unknown function (DUF3300)